MKVCIHVLLTAMTFLFHRSTGSYCNDGDITYDTSCPSDCSQMPPRIDGDKVIFNCSVGGQKAVDKYRATYKEAFQPDNTVLDAPKMLGIEVYWKTITVDTSNHLISGLKLTFSLPKGIKDSWKLPSAILLVFESIPGQFEDCYYVKSPREKLFQFRFDPVSAYDVIEPRTLTYDCFIGLDEHKETLVYNITLHTAEGKSVSYITTVKVRLPDRKRWFPVIMTQLDEDSGTVNVIVEKPPPENIVNRYKVSLVDTNGRIVGTEKINVFNTNSTKFGNLTKGRYRVKVEALCYEGCTKRYSVVTESYWIDVTMLPGQKDYPHYLEETLDPTKIAAMVIGCIFGILLVLTIAFYVYRRQKCQDKPSSARCLGILLHPYTEESDIPTKLKQYVTYVGNCTITDCLTLHPGADHNPIETSDKVKNLLNTSSFVLVLYTSECYNNRATSFQSDFYSCFLKKAMSMSNRQNGIKIIPIKLPFNANNDLPSIISENSVISIELSSDPECIFNGLDIPHLNKRDLLTENNSPGRRYWQELHKALCNAQGNAVSQDEGEGFELSNKTDSYQVECEPLLDKNKEKQLFDIIGKMNRDNDSIFWDKDNDPQLFTLSKTDTRSFDVIERKETNGNKRQNKRPEGCSITQIHANGGARTTGCKGNEVQIITEDGNNSGERHVTKNANNCTTKACQNMDNHPTEGNTGKPLDRFKKHSNHFKDNHQLSPTDLNFLNSEDGATGMTAPTQYHYRGPAMNEEVHHMPSLHGDLHHNHHFNQHVLSRMNSHYSDNINHCEHVPNIHNQHNINSPTGGHADGMYPGRFTHRRPPHSHGLLQHSDFGHRDRGQYHSFVDNVNPEETCFQDDITHHHHSLISGTDHQNYIPHNAYFPHVFPHDVLQYPSEQPEVPEQCSVSHTVHDRGHHNQTLSSETTRFKAIDPPVSNVKDAQKVEDSKQLDDSKDSSTIRTSVKSLPGELSGCYTYEQFCPPEDLSNGSRESLQDSHGWETPIMKQLIEINQLK